MKAPDPLVVDVHLPAAGEACAAYEHWAAEIRRLTDAIGEARCPNEVWAEFDGEEYIDDGESCFQAARDKRVPDTGWQFGDRPPNLEEIAQDPQVAACYSCSELVKLIRARKHARQRYGVAKRAVRHVGKRILRAMESAP